MFFPGRNANCAGSMEVEDAESLLIRRVTRSLFTRRPRIGLTAIGRMVSRDLIVAVFLGRGGIVLCFSESGMFLVSRQRLMYMVRARSPAVYL